jgi:8-oxo-dGTP pyrophosphatase MutT (NUDIX family)
MTSQVAAIPVPAATVMLIDSREPLTTFVMRRAETMAFAPGMHVFPGGRLSGADFADVPWEPSGEFDADVHARHLTADVDLARALTVCAVRETFEETGVLLARTRKGEVLGDHVHPDQLEADRLALLAGRTSLADVLTARELVLDPLLLPPWDHWVTPESEPMRFDTRFFVAVLPDGQTARDVSGEAQEVHWREPAWAIAAHTRGEMPMLPPTISVLRDLSAHTSDEDILAAATRRTITPNRTGEVNWR